MNEDDKINWVRRGLAVLAMICLTLAPGCHREPAPQVCAMCTKPIPAEMQYALVFADGSRHEFCCPYCGMLYEIREPAGVTARDLTDHETGQRLPARDAVLVVGGAAAPCCAQAIVAFARPDAARLYQQEQGGREMTFDELLATMRQPGRINDQNR